MYLSRVKIDRNNRRKMKSLSHLGAYHGWVEESFPKEIATEKRSRKLWRIDRLQEEDYLLLLSEDLPDQEKLEKYAIAGSFETKEYNTVLNSIKPDGIYFFRLTANPVISVKDKGKTSQRGRVIPLVTVEQQRKYLMDRAQNNGFLLEENNFGITSRGFKLLRRKNKNIKIVEATYQGILTVDNPTVFRKTLISGIGSKKAYGFGLLTVIPKGD